MFANKTLAVFLILCATVYAAPVERRSFDDGVEMLVARGPTGHNSGGNHPHPQHQQQPHQQSHPAPPHQPHASTSSHPIPVPHNNHHNAHENHSPSSSQYGTPNQSPTHSHHGSPQGGHSPASSTHSFHSAHSPPPSPPPHPGQHMIDAVRKSGGKITPEEVVHIWRLGRQIPGVHPDTQHAWLEHGNERSGMQHIIDKHGPAFAQNGVPHDQIPHLAEKATTTGEIMGTQGRSRTIYKTEHQGSTHHVAVETANNGYVVSMNPSSEAKARKAAEKWKQAIANRQNQPGPSTGNPGSSSGGGN